MRQAAKIKHYTSWNIIAKRTDISVALLIVLPTQIREKNGGHVVQYHGPASSPWRGFAAQPPKRRHVHVLHAGTEIW